MKRSKNLRDASYAGRCDDKVGFFLQMRAIGAPTPEVVAENVGGRLIFYAKPEDYDAILAERGALVVKPRDGMRGVGVRIVAPGDPDRLLQPNEFASTMVVQHPYAAAIYPHSVNTVRVLTAWDQASGELLRHGRRPPLRHRGLWAGGQRLRRGHRRRRRSRHRAAGAGDRR